MSIYCDKTWSIPAIFQVMQRLGDIRDSEMYRTFNMGVGLVFVVPDSHKEALQKFIADRSDFQSFDLGIIQEGRRGVVLS